MGKQHFSGADLELKVVILGCLVMYDTPSGLLEVFCEEITIVTLIHRALSLTRLGRQCLWHELQTWFN